MLPMGAQSKGCCGWTKSPAPVGTCRSLFVASTFGAGKEGSFMQSQVPFTFLKDVFVAPGV